MIALLLLLLTSASDAGHHEHCWHLATVQHTVSRHSDDVCCRCGEGRCRDLPPLFEMSGDHGKFLPGGVR